MKLNFKLLLYMNCFLKSMKLDSSLNEYNISPNKSIFEMERKKKLRILTLYDFKKFQ